MTLKTWKAEFYPKPAGRVSKKDALAHSLRKWEGLRKSNLKKHGVKFSSVYSTEIRDEESRMDIDETSCALCHHYIHATLDHKSCVQCPLYKVHGRSCDYDADLGGSDSPYVIFVDTGNPIPMLRLLKQAKKMAEE